MKNNYWMKIRTNIECNYSNKVKCKTGNDIFDWLVLALFFSLVLLIIYLFKGEIIQTNEALNSALVLLTGIFVMRATKEAYWTKHVMQKELAVLTQSVKNDNLPILVPREGGVVNHKGTVNNLAIRNTGKGLAKEVYFYIEECEIEGNLLMVAGELIKNVGHKTNSKLEKELKNKNKDPITLKIKYKDIYEQSHTVVAQFNKTGENYILDRGKYKL
jgi:hypothetical protein